MRARKLLIGLMLLLVAAATLVFALQWGYQRWHESRWASLMNNGSLAEQDRFLADVAQVRFFGKRPTWATELRRQAADHIHARLRPELVQLRAALDNPADLGSSPAAKTSDQPWGLPHTLGARDARARLWKLEGLTDRTYVMRAESSWNRVPAVSIENLIRKQFSALGFQEVKEPSKAVLLVEARVSDGSVAEVWTREEKVGDKVVKRTPHVRKSYVSTVRVSYKGNLAFEHRTEVKPPQLQGIRYRDYSPAERLRNPAALLSNPRDEARSCDLEQHLSLTPLWAVLVTSGQTDQTVIFREGALAGIARAESHCAAPGYDYLSQACWQFTAACKAVLLDSCIENRVRCSDYRLQHLYGAGTARREHMPKVLQFLSHL